MNNNYIEDEVNQKVDAINSSNNIYDVGTIIKINNFIVEVSGLDNVMFYEKIDISGKAIGYVNCIKEDVVVVALLKIYSPISVGDKAVSTNKLYAGSYSNSSFGRIVNLFGDDMLTGKTFDDLIDIPIERPTIPIMDRTTVNRPLLTGIVGIDLMYPIGKGQRQLILGDKRTGKTQIGLDTIVNQRGKSVICIYVAIGKTKKEVKTIYNELLKRGAIDYTLIISAFDDELPPVISLIPYFALSISEDFMVRGCDVLVVIDDLKRHAEAYREISLLSGKTPGRDAYPADIFYTHSRLLEKGCQHKNGGSVTILPIVETKGGDITDYISTNIISITDGQIVLSTKSFQKGEKPAIDYGLSVSRLGGQVQDPSVKKVGNEIRRKLLSYLETRSVYELVNMDEMSQELKNKFMEGKIILSYLNQYKFSPRTPEEMINMFSTFVGGNGYERMINSGVVGQQNTATNYAVDNGPISSISPSAVAANSAVMNDSNASYNVEVVPIQVEQNGMADNQASVLQTGDLQVVNQADVASIIDSDQTIINSENVVSEIDTSVENSEVVDNNTTEENVVTRFDIYGNPIDITSNDNGASSDESASDAVASVEKNNTGDSVVVDNNTQSEESAEVDANSSVENVEQNDSNDIAVSNEEEKNSSEPEIVSQETVQIMSLDDNNNDGVESSEPEIVSQETVQVSSLTENNSADSDEPEIVSQETVQIMSLDDNNNDDGVESSEPEIVSQETVQMPVLSEDVVESSDVAEIISSDQVDANSNNNSNESGE